MDAQQEQLLMSETTSSDDKEAPMLISLSPISLSRVTNDEYIIAAKAFPL